MLDLLESFLALLQVLRKQFLYFSFKLLNQMNWYDASLWLILVDAAVVDRACIIKLNILIIGYLLYCWMMIESTLHRWPVQTAPNHWIEVCYPEQGLLWGVHCRNVVIVIIFWQNTTLIYSLHQWNIALDVVVTIVCI